MARKTDYGGIQPDRKNANKGTERGRYMVEASLRETGAGRSILLDKDGRIIAGNKTFEAASDIGLPLRIVETDGSELIAVQRTDLDLDDDTGTARKLAYYDNRASQVGLDWDAEQVLADLGAGLDLSAMFKQDELDELLADLQPKATEGDTPAETDRAEELRQKWGVQSGDLWSLGDHLLVCGDCTDPATVARLMGGEKAALGLHDPPYGISIVGRNGTAGNFPGTSAPRLKAVPIVGDDAPFDPLHLLALADKSILWGGNHYADKLPAGSKWLVWDKKDGAFRESDLGDCELAWTNLGGAARLLHHTWQGMYRKGEGERSERMHPTQKPVDLMAWCIEQANTEDGAIVIDCYSGSGTTIIACENLARRCRAVEISPAYVATALERWSVHTGRQPVLVDI